MRKRIAVVVFLLAASRASGQITTLGGGVIGDSSVAAPLVEWRRISAGGDMRRIAISGWQVSAQYEKALPLRKRFVASLALTPFNANSSDRIYEQGEERPELRYDNASFELTLGRQDLLSTRWISDIRGVVLHERVDEVDAATSDFWARPYAGVRARQSYRRVTAEHPFLMTMEGFELTAEEELFAGTQQWHRVSISQRSSTRLSRSLRVGQALNVFGGSSVNIVNAFLVGGSWPVEGVRPLYGYRYAEFRMRRGATAMAEVEVLVNGSSAAALRFSTARGDGVRASGVAVDVTREWRGVGVRAGAGIPLSPSGRRSTVVYASLLTAIFR